MSDFNGFRDNYPTGFSGLDGEEENIYLFDFGGEVEVRSTSEEHAEEKVLNMTIREALECGLVEGGFYKIN